MSARLKKLLWLSLALVLSFTLVALAGCEGLPQEEVDQIVAGAVNAQYDSVSFEMDVPMTLKVDGGSDPGTMTADILGTGAMDIPNQAMWMTMSMDMSVPGMDSQSVNAEAYVLDGWMYSGMVIPDMGEQWMKMELTDDMWQQQNEVDQYLELLETAVEVKYKGTDMANGVECYVLELEPDMDVMDALMLQETSGMGVVDLSGLNLADLYREISVKEWLAKDSYLLQRTEIKVVMEMSPADVGATSDDFDKVTMDIEMVMRFFEYNQPVSVVLPDEALNAEEFSLE